MKKYFYTIGEVSNLLGVKPYVIRYWESEFSFLRPRREEGRIRKYSEENIELLRRIQDMLHNQRYTIEGARQKLKEERRSSRSAQPVATAQTQVSRHPDELKQLLRGLRSSLDQIRRACKQLGRESK
ncbi:MAG TPA: MerR family transcriptional regulator [Candidatus Syntrophosphaera sp.]|jgi:DNA-binding transcriptional MerR regulator|nr:MAG: HTH-type transcriptional repressor YcgE [Candidatus Cloacimonetes bacterium ADurb.Bin088]HNU54444.1 MerR family transcriptional regulator [Candidatus Syntrophosphaera sp.]HOH48906.1 MerR family transcriptional regulator [Candidatus Syntrophosphaera sp.]HPW38570.1 MerR family transcriptional regulator [Candidatus Syntrophosphaera sp.]HPX66707.1 MerR family transcriptional regulator [Candidatus Syntrophosphaera sp.]